MTIGTVFRIIKNWQEIDKAKIKLIKAEEGHPVPTENYFRILIQLRGRYYVFGDYAYSMHGFEPDYGGFVTEEEALEYFEERDLQDNKNKICLNNLKETFKMLEEECKQDTKREILQAMQKEDEVQ